MNKFYVTAGIAEKLRTKGYPIKEMVHYDSKSPIYKSFRGVYYIPRIDEVMDWLREKKKINVLTTPMLKHSEGKFYWGSEIYDISGMPYMVRYKKSIFNQEGYNAVALASIEYCLDNLIGI